MSVTRYRHWIRLTQCSAGACTPPRFPQPGAGHHRDGLRPWAPTGDAPAALDTGLPQIPCDRAPGRGTIPSPTHPSRGERLPALHRCVRIGPDPGKCRWSPRAGRAPFLQGWASTIRGWSDVRPGFRIDRFARGVALPWWSPLAGARTAPPRIATRVPRGITACRSARRGAACRDIVSAASATVASRPNGASRKKVSERRAWVLGFGFWVFE